MLFHMPSSSIGLAACHLCALFVLLAYGLWPMRKNTGVFICALYILSWVDFVVTALVLSCASSLGSRLGYIACSLALGILMALWLRSNKTSADRDLISFDQDYRSLPLSERTIIVVCWISVTLVITLTVALCCAYDPNNYDSAAYRLPRAFLYIARGTLNHLPIGDFRMQLYPFDMTLAYLGLAIHGLAGRWTSLFSLVTWVVGGIAVASTAREFGARRTSSLLAATLYLTAPAVLVSASSSNDDMIAGVPLVISLLFARRWWRSSSGIDATLAAAGLGLSAGSKLHLPFLIPVALTILAVWACRAALGFRLLLARLPRMRHVAGMVAIAGLLSLPALAINVASTGHATPDIPNLRNAPFNLAVAGVNTLIDTASLFLAPIPDLDLDSDSQRRKSFYDAFNAETRADLFSWLPRNVDFSNSPYYEFMGLAASDGYQGVWEQSAWLGFVPWLLLLISLTAWWGKATDDRRGTRELRIAALCLACAFFGWHLARCISLKYVGGAGIYYAFIMAIGAPAIAWLWDGGGPGRVRRGFFRGACLAVLGTNLVSAANAFSYNPQRNIPDLVRAAQFDPRPAVVDGDLRAELRGSARTLIAYTEWELALFDLISVQPKARYALTDTLPAGAVPGYDLSFLLGRVRSEYGELPVRFAHDDRKRLAVVGTMNSVYGPQRAFGHGDLPPPPAISTVAEYAAASDAGGLRPAAGWSPTEHSHRWSDGASSTLDFILPAGATSCALDLTAITLGPQHVTAMLNGEAAGAFDLETWFPGRDVTLSLPDASLIPGRANHLVLGYDAPRKPDGEGRTLALGLVKAAVACRPGGGPDRRAVFDYRASDDAGSAALTRGWSPTERTHRWSNAAESDIDFRLPKGRRSCALDAKAITAGRQTVSTSLNGAPVGETALESWFPGGDLHVDLPDGDLRPGEVNRIAFRFAATQTVQGRDLALGLVDATVRCKIDDTGEVDLPPPARDGFAVLELDQRRDARGALTALSPGRLNGVDPDEAFDIRLELVSPAGDVRPVSDWAPVAWSTWIELPSAPVAGSVHVELRRRERTDIAASVYMPAAAGQDLGLDLRSPPPGVGSSF